MKHIANKLLVVTMLLSVATVQAGTVYGKSFFMPAANNGTASDVLGWSGGIHKFDMDHIYGCFKIQSEYGQNFNRDEIGKYLLMNGTDSAIWGPVKTTSTNTDTDVAGINFAFDDAFKSAAVTFKPKAQDFVTNFGLFVGLDEWMEGLYLQVNAPLQHARWEVELTEGTPSVAAAAFTTGQVGDGDTSAAVYANVTAAFKGDKAVGDLPKWSYGRIDGKRTETKLGDVRLTLGYNFVNKEHAHFGIGVQGLLGAGGKSTAEYVFQPVIGHAGRHGVGGVVDGAVRLWDRDEDHQLMAFLHASAVHLFDNEQRRSYDITNCGKWSRYLLVKKLTGVTASVAGTYSALDNMINVGSLKAKIGVDVAYEANLAFCYQMGNFSVDFGYAVNGHGKEKHKSWVDTIAANTYVLYDLANANADDAYGVTLVAISGLQTGQSQEQTVVSTDTTYLLNNDRLDKNSGLAGSAMEHCVFGGLNYNWMDSDWMPGVGVFGSVHFSGDDNNSFDRWSVGLQGNVSF